MKPIPMSATLEFNQKVREHVRAGREIISLGLGEAELRTPEHIVDAGIRALRMGLTKYSVAPGLPGLLEKISEKLQTENNIIANPDEIIVTPGAKNALFVACMSLLNSGDEVVVIRPCYVSNLPIIHLANQNVRIRKVGLRPVDFGLDQEAILAGVNEKTKLLFLNTPNNPTGRMLTEAEIKFLVNLMEMYPRLHILSDEIYEKLALGPATHISLASIDEIKERVITANGFSKAYFMTGWRIGYVHAAKKICDTMLKVHQHINTNTAVFIQKAAIAALEGPQDSVEQYVQKLKGRQKIYESVLAGSSVLSGTNYEGGYFSFINIGKTGLDCDAFAVTLLSRSGVAIVPGLAFGEDCSEYCRLSFVNRTDLFREGLLRVEQTVAELANE